MLFVATSERKLAGKVRQAARLGQKLFYAGNVLALFARPMPLGHDPELGARFLEAGFKLAALNEALQNEGGRGFLFSAQQSVLRYQSNYRNAII